MPRTDRHLAILGAGPIGMEAALYAATLDLPFTLYEGGRVGEYLLQWGHVRLFSPFAGNSTPLGRSTLRTEHPHGDLPADSALLTGRQHVAAYLEPLADLPSLRQRVRLGTTVLHVSRRGYCKEDEPASPQRSQQPFRLLLRDSGGKEFDAEADVILDCTGVYGQPRWLGDGGIPAVGEQAARPQIALGLEDILAERREHYADRTTLVIGAGLSAATTVCRLAELAQHHGSTWVIWVARRAGTQPLRRVVNDPLRERDQLAARANHLATRGEGALEFHPQTILRSVEWIGEDEGFLVEADCSGVTRTWEVERVIGQVGYEPDVQLFRELQVQLCSCTHAPLPLGAALVRQRSNEGLGVPTQGPAALRTAEPGYYILGAKSNGRYSGFLLRHGFEQVRAVFTLLTGKTDLDLYRKR
jgi:thioredoxin reductase